MADARLNPLYHDIGPANIKMRTAEKLYGEGKISPPFADGANLVAAFLLTAEGTVRTTGAVLSEAKMRFGSLLNGYSEDNQAAVLVDYFKQGPEFFDRYKASALIDAHFPRPGCGGCRVLQNAARLKQALRSALPQQTGAAKGEE
jgi:hypothetical protein